MTDHITLPRSVVEQAIEALEAWIKGPHDTGTRKGSATRSFVALETLRAALAAQQAEPFGYVSEHNSAPPYRFQFHKNAAGVYTDNCIAITPVYTAPQPAQPVVVPHGWKLVPSRCPLCEYQHGHKVGCENNPVDIALRAAAPTPPAATVPVLEPLTQAEIAKLYQEVEAPNFIWFEGVISAVEAAHNVKLAKRGGV